MPIPDFIPLPNELSNDVFSYCLQMLFNTALAVAGAKSSLTTDIPEMLQGWKSRGATRFVSAPLQAGWLFCLLGGGLLLAIDTATDKLKSLRKMHPEAPDWVAPLLVALTILMVVLAAWEIVRAIRALKLSSTAAHTKSADTPDGQPPKAEGIRAVPVKRLNPPKSHGKPRNGKRR